MKRTGWRLTSTAPLTPTIGEVLVAKFSRWLAWYDEVTGLRGVVWAQNRVLELEQQVLLSQSERREVSRSLDAMRAKIRELNSELETTSRGDDKYVQIITQEHRLLKEERHLMEQLKFIENGERDLFSALSSAVRESHEKERTRAERTKYWSIIATLIGSAVGIIGTSINNYFRMRELKKILADTAHLRKELKDDVEDIIKSSLVVQPDSSEMYNKIKDYLPTGNADIVSRDINSFIKQESDSTKKVVIAGFIASILVYVGTLYVK